MFKQTTLFDGPKSNLFQLKEPTKSIAGLMARASLLSSTKEVVDYLFDYLKSHEELPMQEILQAKILILQVIKQLPENLKKKYMLLFSESSHEFQEADPNEKVQRLLKQIAEIELEGVTQASLESEVAMDVEQKEKVACLNAKTLQIQEKLDQMKVILKQFSNTAFSEEQKLQLNQAYGEKNKWLLTELKSVKMELFAAFEAQVEAFALTACCETLTKPIFELKEEVKRYQRLAKELSFSTKGFHKIRERLGAIWEDLKVAEKKRKQQKKELNHKANALSEKLDHVSTTSSDPKKFQGTIKSLEKTLKKSNLLKEDRERLKKKLKKLEEPLLDEKNQWNELQSEIETSELEMEKLINQVASFEKKIEALPSTLENSLELYLAIDQLLLKTTESNNLTDQDRKFIKDRYEATKKARAKSNLDFEQSFILTKRVDVLKKCLESIK